MSKGRATPPRGLGRFSVVPVHDVYERFGESEYGGRAGLDEVGGNIGYKLRNEYRPFYWRWRVPRFWLPTNQRIATANTCRTKERRAVRTNKWLRKGSARPQRIAS